MNKEQLRQSFVDKGWKVDPVSRWALKSDVGGKVKYDAEVVSPDNQFHTAQVIVTADGTASEEAVAEGVWKERPATFDKDVRDYAAGIEAEEGIFAVVVTQVYSADEVAEATVYTDAGAAKRYVAKRRDGTFAHKELV